MVSPVPTVYVVDDDCSVSTALQRLLEAAGFDTLTFSSAEALLESGPLDHDACLILDINLPGLSGFELATRLRERDSRSFPLIFISGNDQPRYADEARRYHALAYRPKPFAGRDLLEAVRRIPA